MSEKILPFNIDILQLTDEMVQGIKPVTVLDIFENNTHNFHQEGLFSTEIFGKVGTKERYRRFSYIQLNVSIIHPIIYKTITDLKSYYEDIIKGQQYAIFDKVNKEFIKSNPTEGETGYTFFFSHLDEIQFQHNSSNRRDMKIDLIEKYKNKSQTNRIVVIPAGYRDFIIEDDGKPSEDEINSIYRKFLSKNNLLSKSILKSSESSMDSVIYSLQETFNDLYAYIKDLLSGKNKLILGKWTSRRIFNSTRNVASTPIIKSNSLNDPNNVSMDQTQVGLYQYMKATLPITIHLLRDKFLSQVFVGDNDALLVNKKTFIAEQIPLSSYSINKWLSDEGLEKVITAFSISESRDLPVMIDDHYLCLIYRNKDVICILKDMTEAKPEWDKNNITPITYAEMYYISIGNDYKNHPALVTRYPITGFGSVYPSYIYLRTTVKTDTVKEINMDNEIISEYQEYPRHKESYFDTVAVSPIHMARLGLDFDGDTVSLTVLFSEQSNQEVKNLLNSTKFYKDFKGSFAFGAGYDTVNYIVRNMTSD